MMADDGMAGAVGLVEREFPGTEVWDVPAATFDHGKRELRLARRDTVADINACAECADMAREDWPLRTELVVLVDSGVTRPGQQAARNVLRGVLGGLDDVLDLETEVAIIDVENHCQWHLYDLLGLANEPWVMACGAKALKFVRPGASLSSRSSAMGGMAGRWLFMRPHWVMVTIHPDTVVKVEAQRRANLESMNAAVEQVRTAMTAGGEQGAWLVNALGPGAQKRCEQCGTSRVTWHDPQGVWWCKGHETIGKKQWDDVAGIVSTTDDDKTKTASLFREYT
jgi:hypothetical protein